MEPMKRILAMMLGAAGLFAADFAVEGELWWQHIQFLADDSLQGREVGTEGYQKAAEYVAAKLETFGLKAAGTSGYMQPVKFQTRQLVEAQSSLSLLREDGEQTLERADATMNSRAD